MKELRGEVPTSAFEELPSLPRLGPSVPKQPKVENPSKGNSLRSSSKHKNVSYCLSIDTTCSSSTLVYLSLISSKNRCFVMQGSLSYGSIGSKKNSSMRKLELPPKFASALTAAHSHSVLIHPQTQPSPQLELPQAMAMSDESPLSSTNGMNIVCSKALSAPVAVALRPQVSQLVHSSHQVTLNSPTIPRPIGTPAAVALPVATYSSIPQNPTFAIASTGQIQTTVPPPGTPNSTQGMLYFLNAYSELKWKIIIYSFLVFQNH